MNRKIHAHVPYPLLSESLDRILRERINPEVYFSCEALDTFTAERLTESARRLREAGLNSTIHAAFMDLNPGATDVTIRQATRKRFEQVFQAAEILGPRLIVFHPGLDELRHGNSRTAWLRHSIDFWQGLLPRATAIGSIIAVENIFEKEPSSLRDLLEAIDSPSFRHCFDVGHWNMFSKVGLEEWFAPFETVDLRVSDNFHPGYALSWLASDVEEAVAEDHADAGVATIRGATVGELSDLWRDPGKRADDPSWGLLERLSTANQERLAAGFEYLGRNLP